MSAGVPRAPDEIELRNIIDKLAGFVARNGPEFERMTKEKQKDNPKFGFLYGGEYYNYYMYKVTSEQAVMRKQQITDSAMNPNVSYQGHHNPVPQQPYHGGGGNQFQYQQQRPGGPPPVLHSGPPGQQPGNIPPTMSTQPQPLFGPPSGGIQQQQLHRQGLPPPQSQAGPPGGSMQMPPNTMPGALQSQQMPGQFPMSSSSQMPTPANSFMAHGSGLPPPSSRGDIGGTPGAPGLMANPVVSSGATGPGQPMGLSSLMNPPGGGSLLGGGMPAATTASTPPQSAPTLPGNPALDALTKQITESESNLKAQYEVLMQQQDNGKNWMLTNNTSQEIGQLILNHLLHKIKHPDTSFTFRLHLLYLLNDLLHHGLRKNVIGLMGLLREFGARLYCFAYQSAEDDGQKEKLHKLVSLWEKNQYFDAATLAKLKDPAATREEVKKGLTVKRAGIATQIATTIQSTYTGYENQHKEFVKHIEQQIAALTKPSFTSEQGSQQSTTRKSRFDMSEPPSQTAQSGSNVGVNTNIPPPGVRQHYQGQGGDQSSFPPSSQASFRGGPPAGLDSGYGGRSSHPPGGLPQVPISTGPRPRMDGPVPSLIPTVPYYDLPAGLMAPLVRLEDCDYTPLNPKDLRLPPPMPPSERLLAAIEAFYTPASHENPRDNEGWERLGLYEYYQAKERAVAEARNRGDVRDKPDKDSDDSDSDGAMAEKKKQEAESSSDSSSEDEKAAPAASSEEDSDDDDDSSDESSSSSSEDDDADDNDDSAGLTEGEKKKKKKEAAKKAKKKAAAKAKKVAKKKAKKAAAKKEKKKLAAAAAKKGGKDKKEKKKKKNKSAAPADEDKKEASGEKKEAATAKQEPSKPEANGTKQEAEKGRTRYTSASPERDPNVQPKEGSHGDGRRRSRSRERGSYKRSRSRSPRQHWQKSRSPSKTPPGPTSAPPIDVVKGNNQHPGGGGTRPGQSTEAPIDHSNKGHQLLRKMGWGGGGLGQHEHGIQEPIKSGEIRDNPSERYRGIGQPEVDPFEQFRKQQAQQFMVTKGASRKKGGPGGGREKR